jgi:hypothetical protein
MIQPLRTIHRWVFTGFAVLLPGIVIVGVTNRHQYFDAGQTSIQSVSDTALTSERGNFRLSTTDDSFRLNATSTTPRPELLVYWSPKLAGTSLPADARLLGTYRERATYHLPQNSSGTVLIDSPTESSIIDSVLFGRLR